jgi:hypothetical protein
MSLKYVNLLHGTVLCFVDVSIDRSYLVTKRDDNGVDGNQEIVFRSEGQMSLTGANGEIAWSQPQVPVRVPVPVDILVFQLGLAKECEYHGGIYAVKWAFAQDKAQAELGATPITSLVIYRFIYRFKPAGSHEWKTQELWRGVDPNENASHLNGNYGDRYRSSLTLHYRDLDTEFWFEQSTDGGQTWVIYPNPKRAIPATPLYL